MMDTLHTVLRSIRGETKGETRQQRDHVSVFREFLDHLDRAARRREKSAKAPRAKARRGKR
jgi:hypothetical protein